jgi:epoxyqueuosine reductase
MSNQTLLSPIDLKKHIQEYAYELGFADIGFTNTDLSAYESEYFNWIGEQFHGDMDYMERHGTKRTRPTELEPGTVSIISVRMNYYDSDAVNPLEVLHDQSKAYISRYALGKDYHKVMRKRLQQLALEIQKWAPNLAYRAFCDSAPVLERPIAEKAGIGFIGKNSLIIHPRAGSWFFLGELYTNITFPSDPPFAKQGCGPCTACIQECPTNAILDNNTIDSRRCISYLNIEYKGSIPEDIRPLMGNRIYGCDDCQLVCPWNKFTESTHENAFKSYSELDNPELLSLWTWDENHFLKYFEGSPIRRIGYEQWQRNLAVSIGNMDGARSLLERAILVLEQDLNQKTALVKEHATWAIKQLKQNLKSNQAESDLTDKNVFNGSNDSNYRQFQPFKAKKYYLPK